MLLARLQTPHHGWIRRVDGQDSRRDGGARRGGVDNQRWHMVVYKSILVNKQNQVKTVKMWFHGIYVREPVNGHTYCIEIFWYEVCDFCILLLQPVVSTRFGIVSSKFKIQFLSCMACLQVVTKEEFNHWLTTEKEFISKQLACKMTISHTAKACKRME